MEKTDGKIEAATAVEELKAALERVLRVPSVVYPSGVPGKGTSARIIFLCSLTGTPARVSQHDVAGTVYTEEHVFASRDDVQAFVKTLTDNGFGQQPLVYTDEWWDTPDLSLAKSNIWLKLRDGRTIATRSCCLSPSSQIPVPIEFGVETSEVMARLLGLSENEALERDMWTACTRRILSMPVMSTIFSHPSETHQVRIQVFRKAGEFWTMAHTSCPLGVPTSRLHNLGLEEDVPLSPHGNLRAALIAASVSEPLSPRTEDVRALLRPCQPAAMVPFAGLEHEDYPCDLVDAAHAISTAAMVPLSLGFRHAAELEHLV